MRQCKRFVVAAVVNADGQFRRRRFGESPAHFAVACDCKAAVAARDFVNIVSKAERARNLADNLRLRIRRQCAHRQTGKRRAQRRNKTHRHRRRRRRRRRRFAVAGAENIFITLIVQSRVCRVRADCQRARFVVKRRGVKQIVRRVDALNRRESVGRFSAHRFNRRRRRVLRAGGDDNLARRQQNQMRDNRNRDAYRRRSRAAVIVVAGQNNRRRARRLIRAVVVAKNQNRALAQNKIALRLDERRIARAPAAADFQRADGDVLVNCLRREVRAPDKTDCHPRRLGNVNGHRRMCLRARIAAVGNARRILRARFGILRRRASLHDCYDIAAALRQVQSQKRRARSRPVNVRIRRQAARDCYVCNGVIVV